MVQSKNFKIFAAVLFLFIAYWFISGLQYAMKYDIMDWFYPMRYLIGECLQNNVLPIWNPYTNLGYALHTDPQSGALYPLVWLIGYFLGYSPFTINLEYILHIFFAFYGMKKLSEAVGLSGDVALLVGLSYACCGFFVGNAQHLTWIISATWIPYILEYYYRLIKGSDNRWRDALGVSFFSFLLLTGGYPAFTIILFYILFFAFLGHSFRQIQKKEYAAAKRFFIDNCIFFFFFVLQSLTFLVYFFEMLPFMVRGETLSLAVAQMLPFSPKSFLSFIMPFVTGGNTEFYQTDISMSNGYFGLIGFLFFGLCFFTKPTAKIWLLGSVGLFFLLVAMGDFAFLRAWLYYYVPLMNLFKYPSLFRLFAMLCFLLLFGICLQKYWDDKVTDFDWKKLKFLLVALLFVLFGFFFYALQKSGFAIPEPFTAKGFSTFMSESSNSQRILIQAPIQIMLLGFLFFIIQRKRLHFKKYVIVLIALDLLLSVQLNLFITAASDQKAMEIQQKVSQLPRGFPTPKENVSATTHHGNGDYYPIWYNNNILFKKIAFNGYNNFKLKNYKQFKDSPGNIEKLKHPLLHWAESPDTLEKSIEITSFSPTNLKANVALQEAHQIIFLQSDYPGWKVKLDGKVIPHFKKEGIFIAANIPAGSHEVEFDFYPKNFLLYFGLSNTAFLFVICFLIFFRKVRKA